MSTLTDLKGAELEPARVILRDLIGEMQKLTLPSAAAWATPLYQRLGLTDAAIAEIARLQQCSVLTNDSGLYLALADQGASVALVDHFRAFLCTDDHRPTVPTGTVVAIL